jgi:hypothetical protein
MRLGLQHGEVHLLERHQAGHLPEVVEEPGAEPHLLRGKVPGAARRVELHYPRLRGAVAAMGQRRARGGAEDADKAAAGGEAAQRRRRRRRHHPLAGPRAD